MAESFKANKFWVDVSVRPDDTLGPINIKKIIDFLSASIVGQEKFIEEVKKILKRAVAGLYDPSKPLGSYILVGPTGVGKTYAVESFARALHPEITSLPLLVVDCGALGHDHEVARLVGAPPGYIGHRESTPIFSYTKLRSKMSEIRIPVILFDEIEKAAPSLQKVLLSILDRGVLQMGDNTEVSFARSIIFFTSNLGSREYEKTFKSIGFYYDRKPNSGVFYKSIEKHFLPELRGRLSGIIPFFPLSKDELFKVAKLEVEKINKNLIKNCQLYKIEIDEDLLYEIIKEDEDIMAYNVRAIKHRIESIVYQVSDYVLPDSDKGYTIFIGKDGGIKVK